MIKLKGIEEFSKDELQMDEKHLKKGSASLVIKEIQIKMTSWLHFTTVRVAKINKTKDSSCWQEFKVRETPLLVWVQTCTVTMETSVAVPLEPGNQPTSKSSYTTLGHIHKASYILLQRYLLIIFIASLFIITRKWKHPRCPSAHEWIKEIYAVEYYSVILKKIKSWNSQVWWLFLVVNLTTSAINKNPKTAGHTCERLFCLIGSFEVGISTSNH